MRRCGSGPRSLNKLEATTRYLLEVFTGVRSFEGQILTADLGNVTLREALLAVTEIASDEVRTHVGHYLKGFDRLRLWRNYLVHGPVDIARDEAKVGAFVQEIAVRNGRLSQHTRLVETKEVEQVTDSIKTFHLYLSRIIGEVQTAKIGMSKFLYEPLASGNRPDLPDELSRDRIYLASTYAAAPRGPSA